MAKIYVERERVMEELQRLGVPMSHVSLERTRATVLSSSTNELRTIELTIRPGRSEDAVLADVRLAALGGGRRA